MTENNKVVYDGQTLIDLTQDDVTASDVRNGVYFHSADGVRGQGTLTSTSIPTADTIAEWDSDAHMNSEDMSSADVTSFVNGLAFNGLASLIDIFYPVGSYYETSDASFDPNVAWGGTWSLEASGKVHVSSGGAYSIGATGGSETHVHTTGGHTLTTSEIPAHNHVPASPSNTDAHFVAYRIISGSSGKYFIGSSSSGASRYTYASSSSYDHIGNSRATANTGGGGSHSHGNTGSTSNMQPYVVVNRWHRTA